MLSAMDFERSITFIMGKVYANIHFFHYWENKFKLGLTNIIINDKKVAFLVAGYFKRSGCFANNGNRDLQAVSTFVISFRSQSVHLKK